MPTTRRKAPPPPSTEEEQIGPDEEQIPDDKVRERARSPKDKKLQEAIAGIYIMIGGALQALPVAALGPRGKEIGKSLLLHADQIASAWIDLAEDDKRVRRILEGFTQFSGWGKVIGLHLEAVGGGMPGVVGARPQQQQRQQQPMPSDLDALLGLGNLFRQQATEEKMNRPEQPTSVPPQNGPPEPDPEMVRRYMADMAAQQQQQQQQQQPRVRQAGPPAGFSAGRNAGIPSPSDLLRGQQPIPDPTGDEFPTSGSDNLNK